MSGIAQVTDVANAFSTTLTAGISATDTTITVDSTGDLTAPCYLIIEPLSGTKREVVLCDSNVTATTFVLSGVSKRGLDAPAVSHLAGAKVISGPVAQHIDDLNARVDDVDRQLTVGASEPGTPQTGDLWVDTTAVGGTYTGDFDFTGDVDIQGTLGNVAAVSGDIPSHDGTSFKPKSLVELDLDTVTAAVAREATVLADAATAGDAAYVMRDGGLWIDVTAPAYGALGDGTDDSTAIQAAITAAEVLGGTVFFPTPASYYNLGTTGIDVDDSNVNLVGASRAVTLRYTGTGAGVRVNAGGGNTVAGFVIENLTIDCQSTGLYGIQFGQSSVSPLSANGVARNVKVTGATTGAFHILAGQLLTLEHCEANTNTGDGFLLPATGTSNLNTTVTMTNCRAIACKRGAYVEQCQTLRFYACVFEQNTEEGVYIYNPATGVTLRSILFSDCHWEANNDGRGSGAYGQLRLNSSGAANIPQEVTVHTADFSNAGSGNHHIVVDRGEITVDNPALSAGVIYFSANTSTARLMLRTNTDPSTQVTLAGNANAVVAEQYHNDASTPGHTIWVNNNGTLGKVLSLVGGATASRVGFFGITPVARSTGWTVTNPVSRKTFDTTTVTTAQLAEVVGTVVDYLKSRGDFG